jgi:hypothetical protein
LKAKILAISFTLLGSWFHSLGAAEDNARSPKVSNLLLGRTNKVPSRSKGMTVDIWIRDYDPPRCFQKKISGRSKHNALSHVLRVFHTMGLAAHTMGLVAHTIGLAALLEDGLVLEFLILNVTKSNSFNFRSRAYAT